MATPNPRFKPEAAPQRRPHRELVQAAQQYIAAEELAQYPHITYAQAGARATRRLAKALGISRPWLLNMRRRNSVPRHHWEAFEQATSGHVKVADFEQAADG